MAINATYAAFTKKSSCIWHFYEQNYGSVFRERAISAENQWRKPLGMMAEKQRNQTVYYR